MDLIKPPVYRNQAWLKAVRSIGRCVLCGSVDGIQAAHRNEGKGMGMKTPDCATACLCHKCHAEIDNGGSYTKAERHAFMDRAIVLTVMELVNQGKVGVK
jgi:hypothetical protein